MLFLKDWLTISALVSIFSSINDKKEKKARRELIDKHNVKIDVRLLCNNLLMMNTKKYCRVFIEILFWASLHEHIYKLLNRVWMVCKHVLTLCFIFLKYRRKRENKMKRLYGILANPRWLTLLLSDCEGSKERSEPNT
jgi:hypothetical protein